MPNLKPRIVIAVADAIVRVGLAKLISEDLAKPFEITECSLMAELSAGEQGFCQLLLIDVDLQPSLEVLKQLSQKGASIILMNPKFPIEINAHVASGVRGIMFRPISREGLRVAIETVLNGDIYVGAITSPNQCTAAKPVVLEKVDVSERLTQREMEVVENVFAGHSNQEIAERLCLSLSTVKSHMRRIMQKMQARDRISLIHQLNSPAG